MSGQEFRRGQRVEIVGPDWEGREEFIGLSADVLTGPDMDGDYTVTTAGKRDLTLPAASLEAR